MSNRFGGPNTLQSAKAIVSLRSRDSLGVPPTCPTDPAPEKFKIVVADDSRVYRSLVEGVLTQGEYDVRFAKNGREALDAIRKHQPSLVITDWRCLTFPALNCAV
jgi:PleD family two-component response regulator